MFCYFLTLLIFCFWNIVFCKHLLPSNILANTSDDRVDWQVMLGAFAAAYCHHFSSCNWDSCFVTWHCESSTIWSAKCKNKAQNMKLKFWNKLWKRKEIQYTQLKLDKRTCCLDDKCLFISCGCWLIIERIENSREVSKWMRQWGDRRK